MGYINNILGETQIENIKLASSEIGGMQYSLAEKVKPQEPSVSFIELEYAYKMDSINFTSINRSVQMIMAGGFKRFVYEKKKSVVKNFDEFFENIGEVGGDLTFEELLEGIFRDEMVFGNSYVEIIFNDTEDKIVDLALVDPKKIDYAKTHDGKIILDSRGNSIGYMIKLGSEIFAEGDPMPEKYERHIKREGGAIFVLAKRICQFKLYTIGDRFYGVGLLEPSYKSVLYKKNIEKGQANSIYTKGFNPIIGYVGSDRKMATPKDIDSVNKKLQELESTKIGTFPEWVKVDTLKMDSTDLAESALKDMRIDQFASLGTPEGLVSKGEGVNKSTLGDQRVIWEFTLKDIIKQTMSYFKKYILKPINEYNGYGGVPEIEWGELKAEDIDVTVGNIIRVLTSKSSMISQDLRNDMEGYLRELMVIGKYKPPRNPAVDVEKQKVESKEEKKELKRKLTLINSKLVGNLEKINELKKEKENLNQSMLKLKEDNEFEKQKLMAKDKKELEKQIGKLEEKNKKLETKVQNLVEGSNSKISERDTTIQFLQDELSKIKNELNQNNQEVKTLVEDKKMKLLERKEKILRKLEEEMQDGK